MADGGSIKMADGGSNEHDLKILCFNVQRVSLSGYPSQEETRKAPIHACQFSFPDDGVNSYRPMNTDHDTGYDAISFTKIKINLPHWCNGHGAKTSVTSHMPEVLSSTLSLCRRRYPGDHGT